MCIMYENHTSQLFKYDKTSKQMQSELKIGENCLQSFCVVFFEQRATVQSKSYTSNRKRNDLRKINEEKVSSVARVN